MATSPSREVTKLQDVSLDNRQPHPKPGCRARLVLQPASRILTLVPTFQGR
jgi:hypothetical protein